jgi:hypothetical protein
MTYNRRLYRLPHSSTAILCAALVALTAGCGDDEETSGSGTGPVANTCDEGQVALPNGCMTIGVPPEACGLGFEPDGEQGCRAVLPAEPCPPGTHAALGTTTCELVAPCDPGQWGSIPVDATTQHVDASYGGGSNDGTAARPWTTVAAAISAAAPGAIVAIAAGNYAENQNIAGKSVRLWGVCPSLVTIAGVTGASQAIIILAGADGTEVHNLAVTGQLLGIACSGSENVIVDSVWVHDTGGPAVEAVDIVGPASIHVSNSLLENVAMGVHSGGASVTVEDTTIRDVFDPTDTFGFAIGVEPGPNTGTPATLAVRRVVADRNQQRGISMTGSQGIIEDTLVRGGFAGLDGYLGNGISVTIGLDTGVRSLLELHRSVITGNQSGGVFIGASDANITATVIEDSLPQPADLLFGGGLEVVIEPDSGEVANVLIQDSVLRRNVSLGALVVGSNATFERVIIRDVLPRATDGLTAMGLEAQAFTGPTGTTSSTVTANDCLVERTRYIGFAMYGANVAVNNMLIRDTATSDTGQVADGISAAWFELAPDVTITRTRVEGSVRAGVSSFGGFVRMQNVTLHCNAIPLNGETSAGVAAQFDDLGDNSCLCDDVTRDCKVQSSTLEPPSASVVPTVP